MALKVIELFGGIGACSKALSRLDIEHEIVDYVEIDKYAVKSFNAIHNTNFEPQDICEWDKDIEVDLIMHGSPCQDFSLAGKQAGGDKDSGTRSSLMYETIRIVSKLKPKYVIWENVKNLLSKKHRHNFDAYLETMKQLGYINHYQVLNAKDYGIPQNRERIFTISIRDDSKPCVNDWFPNAVFYDETIDFDFPPKQELKLKLKDMLEEQVDEKYYLSDKMVNYILDNDDTQKGTKWEGRADNDTLNSTIAHTLSVRGAGGNQRAGVSNFIVDNYEQEIKVKDIKKQINKTICLNSKGGRNGVERLQPSLKDRIYDSNGIATCCATSNFFMPNYTDGLRIRKLTPREVWRLMGFDDTDYEKATKVNSNTQLYKQAGNSIVVNVLEAIFKKLLIGRGEIKMKTIYGHHIFNEKGIDYVLLEDYTKLLNIIEKQQESIVDTINFVKLLYKGGYMSESTQNNILERLKEEVKA